MNLLFLEREVSLSALQVCFCKDHVLSALIHLSFLSRKFLQTVMDPINDGGDCTARHPEKPCCTAHEGTRT
ncbi:MAG: hypothetical protein AAFO79_03885 [Pseudomonadota bacterium]